MSGGKDLKELGRDGGSRRRFGGSLSSSGATVETAPSGDEATFRCPSPDFGWNNGFLLGTDSSNAP